MGAHGFLQLSPDIPTTAYSHPSSNSTNTEKVEPSSMRELEELVTSVNFNVQLRGLAIEDNATPYEMYCPRVRRSQFTDCDISHLDVVSTWKGLSCTQAAELIAWERLFRQCLSDQVKKHLGDDIVRHLGSDSPTINEFSLLPRLLECLSEKRSRFIDIDFAQLTRDMVDLFYERHVNGTDDPNFPWSLGSRDLPSFVYNFIRTQDCFFPDSTGPYLSVQYANYAYVNSIFTVTADLAWHRPDVEFDKCIIWAPDDEEYRITPYHTGPELTHQPSSFKLAPDHTYFSLSRTSVPFQWDSDQECFRVLVSDFGLSGTSIAETVVCVHINTSFPDNVRFERISRHSIKLHVTQPNATLNSPHSRRTGCPDSPPEPSTPSLTYTPFPKLRFGESRQKMCTAGVNDAPHLSFAGYEAHTTIFDSPMECDIPSEVPPCSSPKKRRASTPDGSTSHNNAFSNNHQSTPGVYTSSSDKQRGIRCYNSSTDMKGSFALDQFQHRDLEVDSKRRKLRRADSMVSLGTNFINNADISHVLPLAPTSRNISHMTSLHDDEMDLYAANFSTGPIGQAHGSPPWRSRGELATMQSYSPPRRSIPVRLKATRETVFRWNGSEQGANHFNGPSTEHSTDEETNCPYHASPPNTTTGSTVSKQSAELSQEQIQQNYREFEEQAWRRSTAHMYDGSMVARGNGLTEVDMELENAFLDVSEAEDWVSDESLGEGMSE
ncbi:hypothetical protein IQ07DRAFT_647270 [Pyrenochaeta sp. DS3sAY3a]|nr:hypothetical protein IQ07DRAFT_647270 [Pyrenochaeta sp. DS3sAY3a]